MLVLILTIVRIMLMFVLMFVLDKTTANTGSD
jgi:hypothetical protein